MQPIYQYDIIVTKEFVDGNRHVNNVVYVQWMQDAAVRHSRDAGCAQATKEAGAIWVARSHWIKYIRPTFKNDLITVLTWVSDIRKVGSLRKYRFVRVSDQTILAEGETDWAFVDAKTGRPRVIPKNIANAFTVAPKEQEPDMYL
ncbi:MAG: acyl-CoA thioesterase [Candidatus Omnitrophota bacterium]|jgi:acyl-CoA thioester hydrolase|nr:MAG: acyl-CoA thioesterase [Candidatus Omnitrophota bacterium]